MRGKGYRKAFMEEPAVLQKVSEMLHGLRAGGQIINVAVARSFCQAALQQLAPQLLQRHGFKCSNSWVRKFLRCDLDMRYRRATGEMLSGFSVLTALTSVIKRAQDTCW